VQSRALLAVGLFLTCAAFVVVPPTPRSTAEKIVDNGIALVPREKKPSPQDLPNDCVIVATEAASRLAATGVWTRVLICRFFSPLTGKIFTHALVVWQPPTARFVCIYDWNGTFELETTQHDCKSVADAFGKCAHLVILEAHYLR